MPHRVLIIDDEEDIRTVAAMALDVNSELDVRTCGSGVEGQQIAEWWQPHLILLDVRMPGLSGPETLNELRSAGRTNSIPVVFFTASIQKHERDGLMDLGAEGIISKPFDPMALAAQILDYLPAAESNEPVGQTAPSEASASPRTTELMKSLLYVSQSRIAPGETDIEVQRIVATARNRNEPAGITGALIFTHSHFAQFLEGPAVAIDQLMERLRRDTRHVDVRVISTPTFSRRRFSDWSMAYGGSSVYVSQLVKDAFERQEAGTDPEKLMRLMREFTNDVNNVA